MSNPELPTWHGAAVVYSRLYAVSAEIGRREYAAFLARKRPRKSERFNPSQDMRDLAAALNSGCEETLKGLVFIYRDRGLI